MPSGNGIVKSGGGKCAGLWSKKSGGWGDRGGMAQINIASSHRMMTAVFVAITYQRMSLEANFSALEREWNILRGYVRI